MIKFRKVALVAAVLILAGCAAPSHMKPAANQKLSAVASQSSRIVFVRSSELGSAINASLFDVTGDDVKFIGILANATKIVYDLPPGTHRLMVVSEAADFMEAKLAPGKTYYAVVQVRMGAWKARFSMWPVKEQTRNAFNFQNPAVLGWVRENPLVENTPESQQWFTANLVSVRQKYADYLPVWQQKTPEDVAERTLEEKDGRNE